MPPDTANPKEGVHVIRFRSLALLAVLLTAGCWFYFFDADSSETRTWSAAAVDTIDVRSDNGEVTVTAATDTVVTALITRRCRGTTEGEAEARLVDVIVTDDIAGRKLNLAVEVPSPNNRSYLAELAITAPAATVLAIHAANGEVRLVNMAAFASATSNNGGVIVTGHSGSLDALANNGLADCSMAAVAAGDTVAVHSDNGEARLTLPADASATFLVSTGNGAAHVEGFANVHYDLNEAKLKRGTLGAGGADVTVTASNGAARLKAR